jgi:hypothetical protein
MYSLCRYIPTDVEIELCSSVKTTDEKILLVSLLVFTDFLVVFLTHPSSESPLDLKLAQVHTILCLIFIK